MSTLSSSMFRLALILLELPLGTGLASAQPPPPVWHNPVLAWAGGKGYKADGVQPDLARVGYRFVFRARYKHQDKIPPVSVKVAIKGPAGYALAGCPFTMTSNGTTNWTTGAIYTRGVNLNARGNYSYRFIADDGVKKASLPVGGFKSGPTAASPPVLAFVGNPGDTTDGVGPDTGPAGRAFTFRIKYSHADNIAPTSMVLRVWGPSGAEITGSPFLLNKGGASTDYKAGVVYWRGVVLRTPGIYHYRFAASDGIRSVTFPDARLKGPTVTAAP